MSPKVFTAPPPHLAAIAQQDRLSRAGSAIRAIVSQAISTIAPERVYLFGSRATDTARPLSDIDLAFVVGESGRWSEFATWVREEAPTLLDTDLVDLAQCDARLREDVMREGIVIYER